MLSKSLTFGLMTLALTAGFSGSATAQSVYYDSVYGFVQSTPESRAAERAAVDAMNAYMIVHQKYVQALKQVTMLSRPELNVPASRDLTKLKPDVAALVTATRAQLAAANAALSQARVELNAAELKVNATKQAVKQNPPKPAPANTVRPIGQGLRVTFNSVAYNIGGLSRR
jgi:hypothetical protein